MSNRIIVLGAFLIGLGLGAVSYKSHSEGKAPWQKLATIASGGPADYCALKDRCLAVYVAPWCPACNSIAPLLKKSLAASRTKKEFGMKIFVGQERQPGHNDRVAAEFGPGTFVDADGTVLAKLGVSYFPSFFVLDKQGEILLSGDEAREWAQKNL